MSTFTPLHVQQTSPWVIFAISYSLGDDISLLWNMRVLSVFFFFFFFFWKSSVPLLKGPFDRDFFSFCDKVQRPLCQCLICWQSKLPRCFDCSGSFFRHWDGKLFLFLCYCWKNIFFTNQEEKKFASSKSHIENSKLFLITFISMNVNYID